MDHKISDYLIKATNDYRPEIAICTGSGLGSIAKDIKQEYFITYDEIGGNPKSKVTGHGHGGFALGKIGNKKVICLVGRSHLYEGWTESNVYWAMSELKIIGVKQIIFTNAAGSLDINMPPSSVMMITDHINFSGRNSLIGLQDPFVGGDKLYDKEMIEAFRKVAQENNIKLFEGTYLMVLGPNFETPAEIRMFQSFGAQAVGMSTVQEVLACAYSKIRVCAISIITNYGTGMTDEEITHEQNLKNAEAARKNMDLLIEKYIESL